jgi:hypothetical protein
MRFAPVVIAAILCSFSTTSLAGAKSTAKRAGKFVEKTATRAGKFVEKTGTRAGKFVERTGDKAAKGVKKLLD